MAWKKTCSICSLPSTVREAVNQSIVAGQKYRDIATSVGVSKSSVGRHAKNCLRRLTLETFKRDRYNHEVDYLAVQWPGQTPAISIRPTPAPGQRQQVLAGNLFVVCIVFDENTPKQPPEVPNPA